MSFEFAFIKRLFVFVCLLTSLAACNSPDQGEWSGLVGIGVATPSPTVSNVATISANLAVVSGDAQIVSVNSLAAFPLIVLARDSSNNPISGSNITFLITGSGTLNSATATTNSSGLASVNYTAGATSGNVTITATSPQGIATFHLTVGSSMSAGGASLNIVSGNNQIITIGQAAGVPLKVIALDSLGNPISGASVSFTANGGTGTVNGVNSTSITTAGDGSAQVSYVAGSMAGAATVSVSSLQGATAFSLTIQDLSGYSLSKVNLATTDNQSGYLNQQLANDLKVRILDPFSNAVVGITVRFQCQSAYCGGFSNFLNSIDVTTDSSGYAQVPYMLGTSVGVYTIRAMIPSQPSLFTDFSASAGVDVNATVSLSQSTVSVSTGSVVANGLNTVQLTVTLKDQYGNNIPNASKLISVNTANGSLGALLGGGFSYVSNGQYTRSFQVGSTVSTETFTGVVSGVGTLTSAPASLSLISNAYDLSFSTISKSVSVLPADGTSTATVSFTLRDSYGNAVVQSGHAVRFNLMDSRAGALLNTVVDAGNGIYTQVFRVSTSSAAGTAVFTVDFKSNGSSSWMSNVGSPSSVSITINPGAVSIASSTFIATKQAIPPNGTATSALIVSVKDSNGNLVPGSHTVSITKQSGTGTISAVTNNGDGTYTATVTAPASAGAGVFAASLNGNSFSNKTIVYANLAGTTIDCTNYVSGGYNGMDVYIESGTLTINTRVNDSLGCSLVFNSLTVGPGGVVTHSPGTPSYSYGMDFTVTGALTVLSGGLISADSKGYYAGYSGSPVGIGFTQGNTTTGGANYTSCIGAGGSHGGKGGDYSSLLPITTGAISNAVYDSASDPTYPGASGGSGYTSGCISSGGFGGGVIRITAASMVLNGDVSASGGLGTSANSGTYLGGGGAGGSIKLALTGGGSLTGSALIKANGGAGGSPSMNSGSGGRIAIHGNDTAWPLSRIQVNSGNSTGFSFGTITGGTIWRSNGAYTTAQTLLSDLFFDDTGNTSNVIDSNTDLTVCNGSSSRGIIVSSTILNLKSLSIASNCWMSSVYTMAGVNPFSKISLNITHSLNVGSGAIISADSKGYPATFSSSNKGYTIGNSSISGSGFATGNGTVWPGTSTGGSYGGRGGYGMPMTTHPSWFNSSAHSYPSGAFAPNATYGLASDPQYPGSSGATYNTGHIGSNGGGMIHISAGSIVNDGVISANGSSLTSGSGGAGSGGAIKITVNGSGTLSGIGMIKANGGSNSISPHASGGGGRIAIIGNDSTWPLSQLQVNSGSSGLLSWHTGGTIYRSLGAYVGNQTLDSDIFVDQTSDTTNIFGSGLNLTLAASRLAVFDVPISLAHLTMNTNSLISNSFPDPGVNPVPYVNLTLTGNLTINTNAKINTDYRGYPHGAGTAAGYTLGNSQSSGSTGGGGAYGGTANRTAYNTVSNATYGSVFDPNYPGSGSNGFGSGGGLIRIRAASIVNHGSVSANGSGSFWNPYYGTVGTNAGSGGGIKLEMTTGTLTGTGMVSANGGSGSNSSYYLGTEQGSVSLSGAGGGGRIAFVGDDSAWPLSQVSVSGSVPLTGTSLRTHLFNPGTFYRSLGAYSGSQTLNTDLWIENNSSTTNVIGSNTSLTIPAGKTLVLDKSISLSNLTLESGSMISSYQSTNLVNRTEIHASGTISIQSASKIDVTGRGYLGSNHPLNGTGFGIGYGFNAATPIASSANWYWGGNHLSYGINNTVAQTWDSASNPNFPGGGGASYDTTSGRIGMSGGGVVRLYADILNLGGSILADGQGYAASNYSGGGAGGSIYINVNTLNYSDSPLISVKGGSCGLTSGTGGGGAGGLVKIIRQTETGSNTPLASGGIGTQGNGSAGTITVGTN